MWCVCSALGVATSTANLLAPLQLKSALSGQDRYIHRTPTLGKARAGVPYPRVLLRPKAVYSRGPPEELLYECRPDLPQSQVISIASIRTSLAADRLAAYATPSDVDALDPVARYLWNIALGQAMQPALHFLEICLRNHIFDKSRTIVLEETLRFDRVSCWLDAMPSLLEHKEREAVEDAKAQLLSSKKTLTPGRLVSKLSFGFWLSLCKRPYEQGNASGPALWPALARKGFPFMSKEMRSRGKIFEHLDHIRVLRNRISHHEPIWDRDLKAAHTKIIEAIAWMNQNLADSVKAEARVESIIASGPTAYRALVSSHVTPSKIPEQRGTYFRQIAKMSKNPSLVPVKEMVFRQNLAHTRLL